MYFHFERAEKLARYFYYVSLSSRRSQCLSLMYMHYIFWKKKYLLAVVNETNRFTHFSDDVQPLRKPLSRPLRRRYTGAVSPVCGRSVSQSLSSASRTYLSASSQYTDTNKCCITNHYFRKSLPYPSACTRLPSQAICRKPTTHQKLFS